MNIRILITLFCLVFLLSANLAHAKNNKRLQFVLGPVEVSPEQTLKVCSTDTSFVVKQKRKSRGNALSMSTNEGFEKVNREALLSTSVQIFDSTDTTRPMSVRVEDIVYAKGKGGCASILGYDIDISGLARSVIVVLTSNIDARSTFDPTVTGQIKAPPGSGTNIGLLLPAIQK